MIPIFSRYSVLSNQLIEQRHRQMQTLLEFLPVVAFVGAYWLTDLHTAIAVIMMAVVVQMGLMWLLTRRISRMTLISSALVISMGGLSLALQNDLLFKWKPTILNWLFAVVFLGSRFLGSKTITQRMLQSVANIELPLQPADWHTLNLMWVIYFLLAGSANLYVAYNFSEAFWVNFKLFGLLGMTFVFIVIQAAWLSRRANSSQSSE